MILKTNLHFHTGDDPLDKILYTTRKAIDFAGAHDFGALALTCHTKFAYKQEYADYANKKGILLIPGIEASIENRDVLILGCDKEAEKINTFEDLKSYKAQKPDIFIIAPHPFVASRRSLKEKLLENIGLFDAIELTVFSNLLLNFNKKAEETAIKYKKPLIATSDSHSLKYLKRGYALIDVREKTIEAVLNSIRKGNFRNKIMPMSSFRMLWFKIMWLIRIIINLFNFPPKTN